MLIVALAHRCFPTETPHHRRHLRSRETRQLQRRHTDSSLAERWKSLLARQRGVARDVPRLQKVNAATGEAVPFFDAAKMQAAFAALPGITAENARQLSTRSNYNLNPAQTAALINWSNDLFYYEFGSDRAIRLTSNPEEEAAKNSVLTDG